MKVILTDQDVTLFDGPLFPKPTATARGSRAPEFRLGGAGVPSAAPTAPAQFSTDQWTISTGLEPGQIVLNVSELPSNGGSAITALEYTIGGAWIAMTGTGTGPRTLTMAAAGTSYTFAIRAVNAINPGTASTTKTATSGAAAVEPPPDPVLTSAIYDDGPTPPTLTWESNDIGTLYWLIDANATRTPAQIVAGGPVSGSFASGSGGGSDDIDVSGLAEGSYYLHAVLQRTSDSLYSNVVTDDVTIVAEPVTVWSPADLPSLALWADASDTATVTQSSGTVSEWRDKSGNARHITQATAGSQPSYVSAALDGKSAIRLAAGKFLDVPNLGISGSAARTVFAVTNLSTTGTENAILSLGNRQQTGAPNYARWSFRADESSGGLRIEVQGAGYSSALPATGAHVLGIVLSGTTMAGHLLSGDGTTAAATGTAPINTEVGPGYISRKYASGTNTDPTAAGDYAELIVCAAAVSTADRQRIEGYLAHKWGLEAQLPAAHPYKSAAP